MRIHLRFFQFLSILLVLLSGDVIANDDDYLVDIEIPTWQAVIKEAKYLNPTQILTNRMTQWANSCTSTAISLNVQGQLMIKKRDAAKIAAFGPDDEWQGNLVTILWKVLQIPSEYYYHHDKW